MKKLLLLTAICAIVKLNAQSVPNGGFEYWNSTAYSEPNLWNTGNTRDVPRMGVASITKVTGFAGFAVRIQNVMLAGDTSDSYIINTKNPCSDPNQWTGGVSYTQQPTSITGKFRYNLLGNDTAILLVIFRKNGVHIGDNWIKIRGTGTQSTFTSFTYTLACSGVPDSLIIAAATNVNSGIPSNNGSYLELDNLAFTGATQAIPNGDFENWTNYSFDLATGWNSWGPSPTQTTGKYSGTYAYRLETKADNCSSVDPSGITSGKNSKNGGPIGGRPYTKNVDTLCGYYKYTSVGNDTAEVFVTLKKNGSNIGGYPKKLTASAAYIYFELPFSSGTTPDTIRIDIQSSKWPVLPSNIGSVLYVDNIYLKSSPLAIKENVNAPAVISVFPNPAKDVLYIRGEKEMTAQNITVYDAIGKIVRTQEISNGAALIQLNIGDLTNGLYYFQIQNQTGEIIRNKFIKE